MKKETRYRYHTTITVTTCNLTIMQFIDVSKISAHYIMVDVIYSDSEDPYYSIGKKDIPVQFWNTSTLVRGRTDKIHILLRQFE